MAGGFEDALVPVVFCCGACVVLGCLCVLVAADVIIAAVLSRSGRKAPLTRYGIGALTVTVLELGWLVAVDVQRESNHRWDIMVLEFAWCPRWWRGSRGENTSLKFCEFGGVCDL